MKKGIHSALFRSVPAYLCGQSSACTILGWGITQSCSMIISYIYFYCVLDISMLCWQIHLSALSMHSSTLDLPVWVGQNVLCDLHVGLPFLLKDLCCLGDISVSPMSPLLLQANVIQLCRVCGAVHLTLLLPTPNINNRIWYKRLKVSKTAHEETNARCPCFKRTHKRRKFLGNLFMLSPVMILLGMVQWRAFEKML